MANTLEILDGTNTYNLWDGTNYRTLGFDLSPLQRTVGVTPDGSDIGYAPRVMALALRLTDTSKANLLTRIRALEEICHLAGLRWAERRTYPGNTMVTVSMQYGTAANTDVVFDVIEAWTVPPRHVLDVTQTETLFSIGDQRDPYRVFLRVRPFAIGPSQSISADTLENEQDSPSLNYQDITGINGDAPARAQIKLVVAGETGTKKVYVAKRSGGRRTDTLWRQGESSDAFSDLDVDASPNTTYVQSTQADAAQSDGNITRVRATNNGSGTLSGAGNAAYVAWNLSGPPRGLFRVLAMVKATSGEAAVVETTDMSFAMGWAFGSLSSTPSSGTLVAADNTYELMDLGELRILPTSDPLGQTLSTFQLRIYCRIENSRNIAGASTDWSIDYIFLVPIDEGAAIISHVAADDLLLDTRTQRSGVYQLNAADAAVEDLLTHTGAAFDIGPEDTRLLVLRDDVIGVTFATTITLYPRYRVV